MVGGSGRGDRRDDGREDAHNDDTHSLDEPEALDTRLFKFQLIIY